MIKWIVNACPFAPGVAKPAIMPGPNLPKVSLWNKMVNRKTIILVLSLVSLTLLYSHNYPALNYSGKPLLFEDMYFVKLSLYTYVSSMIGYYIREHKRKQKNK